MAEVNLLIEVGIPSPSLAVEKLEAQIFVAQIKSLRAKRGSEK